MIRRPPRSTPLYSSAASDVYKRQVRYTWRKWVGDTCVYTCVVLGEACPRSSWISRISAPPSNRWVANECLRVCGDTCDAPPTSLIRRMRRLRTSDRDRGLPRLLRKTASSSLRSTSTTPVPQSPSSAPLPPSREALLAQPAPFSPFLLSLIHISEPTRLRRISYAVFCLKKKKKEKKINKSKILQK